MLLILLFFYFVSPQPAVPAADLDFVVVDKYFTTLPDKVLSSDNHVRTEAGYGDFLFIHFSRPVKNIVIKGLHERFRVFSASAELGMLKNDIILSQPSRFLIFFLQCTNFVDAYLPRHYKVVLNSVSLKLSPLILIRNNGVKLRLFVVRRPVGNNYFRIIYVPTICL